MASRKQSLPVRFDWAGIGWQFLFFWYFSGIVQAIIYFSGIAGFTGTRQALLMSLLWLVPTLLLPASTKPIAVIVGVVLWGMSLVSLSYLYIYHQEFSQSVLFILFESNISESTEFVSNYFSWWLLLGLVLYSVGAYLAWKKLRPVYMPMGRALGLSLLLIVTVLIFPVFKAKVMEKKDWEYTITKLQTRMEPVMPWQMVISYIRYREQLNNMHALLQQNSQIAPLSQLKDSMAGKASTLVLVMGESTNRQRMSLYGYGRPTTPRLDAMAKELTVFTDVVSPRPYTIEVLQQVLSFGDQQHPDMYLSKPSLLNMMKQAGYKTYWITNQQTITKRNTMLTMFSKQTDEQYYLNNNRNQNGRQYDEAVLAPFEQVLTQSAPRKFIVVHLLGTHMNYKYRYPQAYDKFNDRQGVPEWVNDHDQLEFYNSYDNAVLYNDFVVSSLIHKLTASKPNGFLLYLSDHGEEVFDHKGLNFKGRNEAAPLDTMYTIPFVLWTSPQWQRSRDMDLQAYANRPYGSSSLIHTWADLAGLSFDELDPSKSVVNSKFMARPRLIGDPYAKKPLIDFDTLRDNK